MKIIRTWWFIAVLFLLVGGFFYRTALFGLYPVPSDTLVGLYHPWRDMFAEEFPRGVPYRNFLITDPIRQQIPWRKLVIDAWKQGEVPKYNAYAFAGVPLNANVQAAPFYPLNVLFLMFDFPVAWSLLITIQPFLAGLFLYLYLRGRKLHPVSALTGSISWAFGGFAVSWLTWGTIMHAALWVPLLLLAIDRMSATHVSSRRLLPWLALTGFSASMIVFGGHIQIALYGLLCAAGYAVWKRMPMRGTRLWGTISVVVAVVAVTSIQWIPMVRLLSESGRSAAFDAWRAEGWFLPWQHLAQFVVPDFFGNPATLNYWGVWNYGEFIGYPGIIPLVFALSAILLAGVPRFFAFVLFISIFFMLPHPASEMLYRLHIPLVSVLQPTRLMMLAGLSLAVLCAFGIDSFLKGNRKALRSAISIVGIALFVLWVTVLSAGAFRTEPELLRNMDVAKRNLLLPTILSMGFVVWQYAYGRMRAGHIRLWLTIGLMGVVVFDLFRFGWKFTPATPASYFFPETNVIRFLKAQPKPFRVISLDDRILPPNVSAYYGIETPEGYDPIAPMDFDEYLASSERGNADSTQPSGFNRIYTAHNIDSPLLPFLNARYVLSLTDVERPFLREVMREGETRVYEDLRVLPRAYLADTVLRAGSGMDTLAELFKHTGRIGIYPGGANIMNLPLSGEEYAEITEYTPRRIRIRVSTISTRLLVILNRYDRRWSARVDGLKPRPPVRVNHLFMGIPVPAGTHDVILSYY